MEKNNGILTRDQFKEIVLSNGNIPLNTPKDVVYYTLAKVNDKNFNDLPAGFKKQLEDEGLYDTAYVAFMSYNKEAPHTVQMLPIYGRSDRYVTKWLTFDPEDAIDHDLRDRNMCLLKRANEYITSSK